MLLTLLAQRHYGAFPLKSATVHGSGEGDVLSLDEILGGGFPLRRFHSPSRHRFRTMCSRSMKCVPGSIRERQRVAGASEDSGADHRVEQSHGARRLPRYVRGDRRLAIYPREAVDRFADTIELWIRAVSLTARRSTVC